MIESNDEANRFKKLFARLTTFQNVSKHLTDGQNGFLLQKLKRLRKRLIIEIKDNEEND